MSSPVRTARALPLLVVLPILLLVVLVASGCGAAPAQQGSDKAGPRSDTSPGPTTSPSPTSPSPTRPSPTHSPPARLIRGVDASHHQGDIDWPRVRADRIEFAYLKASEGSGFVDPRFVANARAARSAGLRVGGYHYFSTCSPGAPQAAHFVQVLRSAPADSMPPAIDLELLGNCTDPPARPRLLAEVRTFLRVVERATGEEAVVYAYPDFEHRYRFAADLGRRQWVRRIGSSAPEREWFIWQRDDRARIAGFSSPADLNLMRTGSR